ncbi:hypothetical protein [Flavobacterium poyangense]|uniref:hypothetical protein n=1 Tax=Flavobacterium poyangense TaxID=2204302 RepID=UPI00141E374D|nr:hypothetical protein [Flavobacterium sp. JXAS1]
MKRYLSILLFCFFSTIALKAQEKDTLFFAIDKYYTISPTITANMSKITYSQLQEAHKEQMKHTKTNGYIYFVGDGYLTKNLKPRKVYSLKDYIENRKFYFDGVSNKIVDKWKLKDSLTNKYTIFFVSGTEFIQPRVLEYRSYYPIRNKEERIYNKVKDTLYFNMDTKYIRTHAQIPNHIYLNDSSGANNGSFFFKTIEFANHLKPKEIRSLEKFVQTSRFYNKDKTQKLNDYELAEYLNNYVVFLVDDTKKECIRVESGFEIE